MTEMQTLPEIPTQIAFPLRALVRTVAQALVGAIAAALARWLGVELLPDAASNLVDLIASIIWVGVTALTAWVMTRPGVAKLLAYTFLAPAPPAPADPTPPAVEGPTPAVYAKGDLGAATPTEPDIQ